MHHHDVMACQQSFSISDSGGESTTFPDSPSFSRHSDHSSPSTYVLSYQHAIALSLFINDSHSKQRGLPHQATVLKIAWYWHKNTQDDHWDLIEDPDINPHIYEHPIFDKEAKNIKWKKKAYLTNGTGITGYQHVEK